MKRKVPFFFHIEKAAGTTLHDILRNNFTYYTIISPFSDDQENAYIGDIDLKKLARVLPRIDGYGGHSVKPYLCYKAINGVKFERITFLREPVSRYISHYFYQKEVMGIDWGINEFINDNRYSNFMTQRIAGSLDVDKAIEILSDFDFVGLTEQFEESLILMKQQITGITSINFEKRNLRLKRGEISKEKFSDETMVQIRHVNSLDIKLYDFVKDKLFCEYKAKYPYEFEYDFKSFLVSNEFFSYNKFKRFFWRAYKSLYSDRVQAILRK